MLLPLIPRAEGDGAQCCDVQHVYEMPRMIRSNGVQRARESVRDREDAYAGRQIIPSLGYFAAHQARHNDRYENNHERKSHERKSHKRKNHVRKRLDVNVLV